MVAAWLLHRLLERRRRLGWTATVMVVLLMGVRSWTRTPTWRHSGTVFDTLLRDYPQSGRSQWVLADLFFQEGMVSESLRSYRMAVGILGGHHQLMTEIAKKLMGATKYRAAEFILVHAWQQEPTWHVAPGILAVSRFQQQDWEGVERFARASLALNDEDPTVAHVLAAALTEQGRYAEAVTWREKTIENGEGDRWEQWLTLARLKLTVGDERGAEMARDSAQARITHPEQMRQIGIGFVPFPPPQAPS